MATALVKGARITGEARTQFAAEATKQYGAGASIRDIAGATGRSYGFVHRVLSEVGVRLRDRGGNTRAHEDARERQQVRSSAFAIRREVSGA